VMTASLTDFCGCAKKIGCLGCLNSEGVDVSGLRGIAPSG